MSLPIELTDTLLKEIFSTAMTDRGTISDVDAATQTGIYGLYNPANAPRSNLYGILIVASFKITGMVHLIFANNGYIYYRLKWDTWHPWRVITATLVS